MAFWAWSNAKGSLAPINISRQLRVVFGVLFGLVRQLWEN